MCALQTIISRKEAPTSASECFPSVFHWHQTKTFRLTTATSRHLFALISFHWTITHGVSSHYLEVLWKVTSHGCHLWRGLNVPWGLGVSYTHTHTRRWRTTLTPRPSGDHVFFLLLRPEEPGDRDAQESDHGQHRRLQVHGDQWRRRGKLHSGGHDGQRWKVTNYIYSCYCNGVVLGIGFY